MSGFARRLRPQRSLAGSSTSIRMDGICVQIAGNRILRDVSLTVPKGEFLTILGPSGSGKTTSLNVVAGFVRPEQGEVFFGEGERITAYPPHKRDIGMVFQSYALFPHLDVFKNVAYPLHERRVPKAKVEKRVSEMLELVGLTGFEKRDARTLSGGQQQRVALARALAFSPRVLLLDEPLGSLDKNLRERMQVELRALQRDVGVTTISVTHDQTEAVSMSDRVAILNEGRLEQVGRPRELYWQPASAFVATFLGEANLLRVRPHASGGEVSELCLRLRGGAGGTAVIRPEILTVSKDEDVAPGSGGHGVVTSAEFHGYRERVTVQMTNFPTKLVVYRSATVGTVGLGEEVRVVCHEPGLLHLLPTDPTGSVEDRHMAAGPDAAGNAIEAVDQPLGSGDPEGREWRQPASVGERPHRGTKGGAR